MCLCELSLAHLRQSVAAHSFKPDYDSLVSTQPEQLKECTVLKSDSHIWS